MTIYLKTDLTAEDLSESDEREICELLYPFYKRVDGVGYYFDFSKSLIKEQRSLFIVIVNDDFERQYMRDLDKLRNNINQIIEKNTLEKNFNIKFKIVKEEDRRYAWLTTGVNFLSKPLFGDYVKARPEIKDPKVLKIELESRFKPHHYDDFLFSSTSSSTAKKLPSFKTDIQEIPSHQLILEKPAIASGNFGFIYKGQWRKSDIVCKQLKDELVGRTLKEFNQEVSILVKLNSPYIIRFYGLTILDNNQAMVMEFCANGSLLHRLESEDDISWEKRISWGEKIAYGLAYLHANKIIHNDLAARNILLDQNDDPKITDFGLSKTKLYYRQNKSQNNKYISIPWTAPERLNLKVLVPNEACDMYSYGVVLWEIASRDIPLKHLDDLPVEIQVKQITKKNYRDKIPEETPELLRNLICSCQDADANKRPTAQKAGEYFAIKSNYSTLLFEKQGAIQTTSSSQRTISKQNLASGIKKGFFNK